MILDLSHHNSAVDFHSVKENIPVVEGVYLKATQGTGYFDPLLKSNSSNAVLAGLKVGYYHYATLNSDDFVSDAIKEARYFLSVIDKLPAASLPLALDIEENKSHLPTHNVLGWIRSFFGELENNGKKDYVIYSYTPFLNANIPSNHGLGNIRLWLAAYVNKPQPQLPVGWDKYWLWQYSAKGSVKGVSTNCDLNKYP